MVATWHSASEVGGERFHVSLCVACLAPLYFEFCGSDQHQHTLGPLLGGLLPAEPHQGRPRLPGFGGERFR